MATLRRSTLVGLKPITEATLTDERMAPDDGIWVCCACGKTAIDRYGLEGPRSGGWDESCMLNAVLCKRDGIEPGQRVTKADPYSSAVKVDSGGLP